MFCVFTLASTLYIVFTTLFPSFTSTLTKRLSPEANSCLLCANTAFKSELTWDVETLFPAYVVNLELNSAASASDKSAPATDSCPWRTIVNVKAPDATIW